MMQRDEIENFEKTRLTHLTRRNFAARLATLFSGLGFAGTALASSKISRSAGTPADEEIIRT
ncbi:MAG: hypothetical protein WCD34_13955, partial [Candidatus Acidiferrum sp.]